MTHTDIILDALRCKASKLRRKGDKAQRDGRPAAHVKFLYDNAEEVETTRRAVEAGSVQLTTH